MELKDSKTFQNLVSTFVGEAQARAKYTFFASVAKKEGFEQISGIFTETAENEKEHGKRAYVLAGLLGDTAQNLQTAIDGEHEEHSVLYKEFARVAHEEGFEEIAIFFTEVGEVEEQHELRFQKLLERVKDGTVFTRPETVKWHCRNCGYVHEGTEPPESCPACKHPKAYYEILSENY